MEEGSKNIDKECERRVIEKKRVWNFITIGPVYEMVDI